MFALVIWMMVGFWFGGVHGAITAFLISAAIGLTMLYGAAQTEEE